MSNIPSYVKIRHRITILCKKDQKFFICLKDKGLLKAKIIVRKCPGGNAVKRVNHDHNYDLLSKEDDILQAIRMCDNGNIWLTDTNEPPNPNMIETTEDSRTRIDPEFIEDDITLSSSSPFQELDPLTLSQYLR